MAQSFVDPIGGTLIIPAAYPSISVAPNNSGLSTTGVIVLLGEAESGPAYSQETNLADNIFGPDQLSDVIAKYGSGNLVTAFRAAASAAVDPEVTSTFSRAILVKTNQGVKASTALKAQDGATAYTSTEAKLAGANGNLIYYTITNPTTETKPTTGNFTYIGSPGTVTLAFNANGGIAESISVAANTTPTAFVGQVAGLVRVTASGGGARTAGTGSPNLTITVVGNTGTFTKSTNWEAAVAVGDTLMIPAGSGFAGGVNAPNTGFWVIQSVSAAVLTATKLADLSTTTGHVAGTVVAPVGVGPIAINAVPTNDFTIYAPVAITTTGTTTIQGAGKSLEVAGTSVVGGDTDPTRLFYNLGLITKTSWVSLSGAPQLLTSASELSVSINNSRSLDSVSESLTAGGEIGLKIGYTGYSCTLNFGSTSVVVTYQLTNVSAPVTLTLLYTAYPTIGDLAAYLNSVSGFSAAAGTAILGNLPTSALDDSTWGSFASSFTAASTWGAQTGRIKIDAYRLQAALANSTLVEFVTAPLGGLPGPVAAVTYYAGGTKGATTAAGVTAAVDALQQVQCNFVVPLFSRDATSDIVDGLTDSGSTYTIDALNAYVKSHVHAMSTMKAKRNRQAVLSKRDTYAVVSNASANIASYRCMMVFEDVKSAATGLIVQYQPWMAAVLAAATQAGGFYKSMVRKQVNITGTLQAAGDWKYTLDSNLESALIAGLNPIKKADEGGFVWVSDQTTYGKDASNFYNSFQMVYAADIVALTTAQRMDRAFIGKSVADVSAAVALSYLDGIMADFLRLKLIAPSIDAPFGYKNAKIVISGATMRVSVEVKIAGSIYFIPISFYVTAISQNA